MPIARFEMPDGRVARFEVPEGTTPEQAQAQIEQFVASSQDMQGGNAQQQQPAPQPEAPQPATAEYQQEAPNLLESVGRGMTDVTAGAEQIGRQSMIDARTKTLMDYAKGQADIGDFRRAFPSAEAEAHVEGISPEQAAANILRRDGVDLDQFVSEQTDDLRLYQQGAEKAPVSSFVGRTVGNIAATPVPGFGPGASVGARMLAGGATGALTAGLEFAPGETREEQQQNREQNFLIGGLFGSAAPGVLDAAGAGVNRVRNAAAGRFASQEAADVIGAQGRVAQRTGVEVPVFFDDVSDNKAAKSLSVASENIPLVGTAGGRARQGRAAGEAAEKFVDDFRVEGLDVNELQQSFRRKLDVLRKEAGRRYDRVQDLTEGVPVERARMNQVLDDIAQDQEALGSLADAGLLQQLQKLRDAPGGDFALNRRLLSRIKSVVRDGKVGQGQVVGTEAVAAMQRVQDALNEDMASAARSVGDEAYRAWRDADTFYRNQIAVPFKQSQIKRLVDNVEPEKAYKALISGGGAESRSKLFYGALDDRGRATVKFGLLQDALDKSTTEGRTFSPAKFARELEKRKAVVDEFFKGQDRADIDGLIKLMRHVERGGQFLEQSPTGNRILQSLGTIGAAGLASVSPTAAGSAVGVAGMTRLLFQSKAGRNLLLAASKAEPGSEVMQRLAAQFEALASRAAAMSQAQPETSTEQQPRPSASQ